MTAALVLQYANGESVYGVFCEQHFEQEARHLRSGSFSRRETTEECRWCKRAHEWSDAQDRNIPVARDALTSAKLSHTRFRNGFVYIYHLDGASPTGVRLAASLEATRYDKLAAELRGQVFSGSLSPLSPTEGL